MQPYQMKDSGVEWLGDIPVHWTVDRLKDVARLRTGKTKSKSEVNDYLELEDISQWTGEVINKRNTLEVSSDVMKFYKNDVLFGKLRPYLAKVVLATFNGKCTGEILAFQPFRVLSKFLAYYLLSKHFINHCNNFSYGAKMPRINWNTQMSMFVISLPPKEEQLEIANYLDKACEKIDKTLAIKQHQIDKLEAYRKSVIHEAVTKGLDKNAPMKDSGVEWLGDIPKHWTVIRTKNSVFKINSGVTPKGGSESYINEGIPLIRSQNVKNSGLDLSDVVFIPVETHNKMSNSQVHNGDVLLNITGASLGRCAYVSNINEANVNQHVCILRAYSWLKPKFLYYLLSSHIGQSQIFSSFKGSGREGLNFEAIKNFSLPQPPKNEQTSLIEFLDNISDKFYKTETVLNKQIQKLTQYRQSLIHECVTGKKRVYQSDIN